MLLTRASNKRQIPCCGLAKPILLARLALQAMVSLVRTAIPMGQLRFGFASLAFFVSYLTVGLITSDWLVFGERVKALRRLNKRETPIRKYPGNNRVAWFCSIIFT